MNERPGGRSETSGRRPPKRRRRRGRPAALVIRLEVGQAPSVVADWDTDEGDEEFTRWLDECPRIAQLAYLAVALAEEAA